MVIPSTVVSVQAPVISRAIAVIEQISSVSIAGSSIPTSPSRTGSRVFAAPCAIASVPIPASLEKAPRLIPFEITTPSAPPAAASPENASVTISQK